MLKKPLRIGTYSDGAVLSLPDWCGSYVLFFSPCLSLSQALMVLTNKWVMSSLLGQTSFHLYSRGILLIAFVAVVNGSQEVF